MLVNLTQDTEVILKQTEYSNELKFTDPLFENYIYQPITPTEIGIYECFHFREYEFLEKTEELCWDDNYRSFYGVADNIEQAKGYFSDEILSSEKYFICYFKVYQELENKYKGDGWRWSKWGPYIGELTPQCEYLDDEEFENFEYIICFNLYKVL